MEALSIALRVVTLFVWFSYSFIDVGNATSHQICLLITFIFISDSSFHRISNLFIFYQLLVIWSCRTLTPIIILITLKVFHIILKRCLRALITSDLGFQRRLDCHGLLTATFAPTPYGYFSSRLCLRAGCKWFRSHLIVFNFEGLNGCLVIKLLQDHLSSVARRALLDNRLIKRISAADLWV